MERGQILRVMGVGEDRTEKRSCLISNLLNNTWRLTRGHVIYTNRCRPLLALSNCPQDRNPVNAFNPSPLKLVVFEPGGPVPR